MKKFRLIILILCLLLCCGCWDKSELENHTFVVMMGIDKAKDEDVTVTIAFPLTQKGGENSGKEDEDYRAISATAPTVAEALSMFAIKLAGPISFFTTKTIVISEELAKEDLLRRVVSTWRYEQMRGNTSVLISSCKASEYIDARLKGSEIDILRQEDLILEQANSSSYYKAVQFLDLIVGLKSDNMDGAAMYGGVAKEESENVKVGYLPGEIPVKSDNKSQISGLAVFSGGRMTGALDSMEAQTLSMVTKSDTKKTLTLKDPLVPDGRIVVSVMPNGQSEIRAYISGGKPVYDINVKLDCAVESIENETDYSNEENYRILVKSIESLCTENMQKLVSRLQNELNADALSLGNKLSKSFTTSAELKSYDCKKYYREADINISVKIKLERAGIFKS